MFCYLDSFLSNTVSADNDITSRLAKTDCTFGKLQRRLWGVRDVSLKTKIAVYRAVVLTTLLYGCETWTLYRRSIRRLDQFHLRCLRKIARVKWQDRIPNTDVLNTRSIMGIEAFLLKAQLRWLVTLCACQTVGFQSKYFLDNWHRENICNVGQYCGTKML